MDLWLKRFSADIKAMLGFDPGWWWKFCWLLCAPVFLMVIIGYGLYEYKPLTYGSYVYPTWANVLGLVIAGSSVACIPIGAIIQFARAPGKSFKQRLIHILTPVPPVFIPTNDVTELLAAAAAASTTGVSSNLNISLDNKSRRNKRSCTNDTSNSTSSCSKSESSTLPRHCGGRISVNCLHADTQSIDNVTSARKSVHCNDAQSETTVRDNTNRNQCETSNGEQAVHCTTIMINPSISLDSTQV